MRSVTFAITNMMEVKDCEIYALQRWYDAVGWNRICHRLHGSRRGSGEGGVWLVETGRLGIRRSRQGRESKALRTIGRPS